MIALKILTFVLFSQIVCSSKQQETLEEFSYFRQNLAKRTLQTCSSVQNCEVCEYDVCLKCTQGRVLPSCDCPFGYIDVSGECIKCPANCQTCSNVSTCLTCNQQYTLNNGQCTCNNIQNGSVCNDPQNLTYNAFIGSDLQSIKISFSGNIRIAGTDDSKQFQMLISNCAILDTATISTYGLSDATQTNAGCYINQNHQNQFIVVLGKLKFIYLKRNILILLFIKHNSGQQIDQAKILNIPKIVSNQVLNYSNGQAKKVQSVQTNQVGLLNQLNQMSKSCYFQNNQIKFGSNTKTKNIPIVSLNNINISCGVISNLQLPLSCTNSQLQIDLTGSQSGTEIQIQAQCTNIFQIQTKDQIIISIGNVNQNDQINILNINKLANIYNYNSKISLELSMIHTQSSKADLTVNIISYPQIFSPISLTPQTLLYNLIIPPYSVTQDTYVEIMVQVKGVQYAVQSVQYFYFQYQSNFVVSIIQSSPITDFNPSSPLTLNAQVLDSNYAQTDLSQFTIQWICLDSNNQPCQQSGVPAVLSSGYQLDLPKNLLSLNNNYNIYAIATRNSDFSNTQKASISVSTLSAQLLYVIQNQQTPSTLTVSLQETIIVYIKYTLNNTLSNYSVNIMQDQNTMRTLQSNSSAISFSIQDLYPNLSFSMNSPTTLIVQFQAMDNMLQQQVSSGKLNVQIRTPPQSCSLGFNGANNMIGFKSQVQVFAINCQFDTNYQPYTYQYFYYQNNTQLKQEILNPQIVNRQEISLVQTSSQINTFFPPGNITLIVVIQGIQSVQTNHTQQLEVKEDNFDQSTYETFLQSQYTQAKQQQDQKQELINYQMISLAIQYYETKQPQYSPPDNINTLKNDIISRLYDASWSKLSQDVILLAQKIISQISKSKIKMSVDLAKTSKAQNEQIINDVTLQISNDQSDMTTSQKSYYQQVLSNTLQNFVSNVNSINSWTAQDCQNMIQQTTKSLDGISQTMAINQAPIIIQTIESVLTVEKLDYTNLLQKYFKGSSSTQASGDKANAGYYVQMQTYPTSSHVYRDELSQINQQYTKNTTSQEILNLLKKTYPVKIPSIKSDRKLSRRRFLSIYPAQLDIPMEIHFGQVTAEEKLKCIQRSQSGQWVSNSCSASVQIIDNQRQISCSCKTPDATSLIADIEQLFDNQNIKDIFNGDGIERLIHLSDWYKYAPIWTIIGLNIFLVIIIIIGCKLDKRDKLNIANKKYQITKIEEIEQIKKSKSYLKDDIKKSQNLFIIIKNNEKITEKLNQLETLKQSIYQEPNLNEKQENQQLKENGNQIILTQQQFSNFQIENDQMINTVSREDKDCQQNQYLSELEKKSNFENKQQDGNTKSQNTITSQGNIKILEGETDKITPINQQYIQNPQPDDKEPHIYIDIDSIKLDSLQVNNCQGEVGTNQESLKNLVNNESPQNNQMLVESQNQIESKRGYQSDQNQSFNLKQASSIQEQFEKDQNQQQSNNDGIFEQLQQQNTFQNQQEGQTQQNILLNDESIQQKNKSKKNLKKQLKEEEEKLKLQKAKEKLDEYLKLESWIKGVFAFHIFLSTFTIYDQNFSRAIRFIIYYNKMVWLLALNSVFGVNLSVVQIIVLSITSTIILLIVTTIITALLSKQKLKIIGLVITFLFLLFCYYSILVVISGQNPQQANIWIGSYFLTLFINEYLIGIPICYLMYYTAKKVVKKVENPIILQIIGTGLLIEALKN
ncbi:hypothetical protein ABPG74_014905 [Tetrahymena malaccensis]